MLECVAMPCPGHVLYVQHDTGIKYNGLKPTHDTATSTDVGGTASGWC